MEKDWLFNYRQPLVTAAGIILGFVLNFASGLVKRTNSGEWLVLLVMFFTLIGIILLIVSLYRILNDRFDKENPHPYYHKTLNFFLWGVIFSFTGGLLKMAHTFFLS